MTRVRDGIDLDVDRFGEGPDPLVLLIPGAGAPKEFWPVAFCERLADAGRSVVRYSHRDTGLSTHVDERYPIGELLDDLFALLAQLGRAEAHLVGHSMGGFLVQLATCERPELVRSATSISAGSTVLPDRFEELGMSPIPESTWEVLLKNEPTGDVDRDLPGWLRSWRFLNGRRPFDEAAAVAYTRRLYEGDPRNAEVAEHHVHAMTTVPADLVRRLRTERTPFLVIHGTDDPLVPLDHGRATARLAPEARLVELDGAGHMFFDDAVWDEIGGAILAQTAS